MSKSFLNEISLGRDDEPGIVVLATSELDARLEAEQCRPERQIYADGRFGVRIAPGDVVIDVGANIGRWVCG